MCKQHNLPCLHGPKLWKSAFFCIICDFFWKLRSFFEKLNFCAFFSFLCCFFCIFPRICTIKKVNFVYCNFASCTFLDPATTSISNNWTFNLSGCNKVNELVTMQFAFFAFGESGGCIFLVELLICRIEEQVIFIQDLVLTSMGMQHIQEVSIK